MRFGRVVGVHQWFAWWPVRLTNGQRAWLETVYRKRFYDGTETIYMAKELADDPWAPVVKTQTPPSNFGPVEGPPENGYYRNGAAVEQQETEQ